MKTPVPFGKYYLLERINVGGMAEVFQAKAFGLEGFERIVAVKRILPSIAEDKEFISMFIDEAKIAVQLNHANICQVFDLGKADDSYYIALEYVSGRDLRAIFDRCKQQVVDSAATMPIAQSCFAVMKVCEGLDYAHNKKDALGNEMHLVHRDVSPQNIIISYEGEVKLIDFGIAKAAGKVTETQAGILKGKFGYMSPEQVRGQALDRRSDIFCVGIVLYEMLTGERLFTGDSDFSTLEKVRNVEILPPTMYNRKIPEELERIVLKALSKEPEDRYPSAMDLHDDLQAFMYTSGEFYSRKDLAAWMKRVFKSEMEAEQATLDRFRDFKPEITGKSVRTTAAMSGLRLFGKEAPVPAPGADAGAPSSWTPDKVDPKVPARPRGKAVAQPAPRSSHSPPPPLPPPPKEPEQEEGGATVVDGMKGKIADFHWEEEELDTHVYQPPAAKPAEEPETRVDSVENLDLSHIALSESGEAALPAAAEGRAAREDPAMAPTVQARSPAAKGWHSNPSFATAAVDGPILTGVQRRSAMLPMVLAALLAGGLLAALGVLGYVVLAGRSGFLVLGAEPSSGLRVTVDQTVLPGAESPYQLSLRPGPHQVTIQRDGYLPFSATIEIRAGETVRKNAQLQSLVSQTGGFTIISDPPGLKAYLDGQELGQVTPMKVQSVLPGLHVVELRQGPSVVWRREVSLEAGKMLDLHAAPPPPAAETRPATPRTEPVAHRTEAPSPSPPPRKSDKPEEGERRPSLAGVQPPRPPAEKPERPAAAEGHVATKGPEKPSGPQGLLRIGSKPWAQIWVDGKATGLNTPQTALRLQAGTHQITLNNPQFRARETFSVTIRAGETQTVVKTLQVGTN